MKTIKQKIKFYNVVAERKGKIERYCYSSINQLQDNLKFLLALGYTVQICYTESEVSLPCLNVWNKC